MSGQRHETPACLYPVLCFLEVSLSDRLSCLLMNWSSFHHILDRISIWSAARDASSAASRLSHGVCAATRICPQISPYQARICRYLSLSSHSYLLIPPFSSVPTPQRHQSLTSPHPLSPRCVSHRLSEHGGSVVVAHVFFEVWSVRDGADGRDLEKDRWKWTSETRDLPRETTVCLTQTWRLQRFLSISMTHFPGQRLRLIAHMWGETIFSGHHDVVTNDELTSRCSTHMSKPYKHLSQLHRRYNSFKSERFFWNDPLFSSLSGRGFRLKMCTTTAAQTTGATTSCPLLSALTERTMFTSLRTATLTPTPGCSTTWPVWSAGTCPTCRGSCSASAWWVTRVYEVALTVAAVGPALSLVAPLVLLLSNNCRRTTN